MKSIFISSSISAGLGVKSSYPGKGWKKLRIYPKKLLMSFKI